MQRDDPGSDTDALLDQAGQGDSRAMQSLLDRHRERLRRMVAARLDRCLAARVDPSDVVQDALVDASRKIEGYLRDRPLPFHLWLRRLAWERIVQLHRRHIGSQNRSVSRELQWSAAGPAEPVLRLVDLLADSGTSPSRSLIRSEQRLRIGAALERLGDKDREVLILRYLEQLPFGEIAVVLGATENAVKVRHFRALERLRPLLEEPE